MPNGKTEHDRDYNYEWCKEKHKILDNRLNAMEKKFTTIIVMLFTNLGGIIAILVKGVIE